MARAMRLTTVTTVMAGLCLALAVVHAPQAPSSTGEIREWSTLPDGAVLQRVQPSLRPLLHAGHTAILPAPIVLVSPPVTRGQLSATHARSFIASRPGNLGARAPPV